MRKGIKSGEMSTAVDRRVPNWLSELSESEADDKGIAVNSK
jgi:hypothetical protein